VPERFAFWGVPSGDIPLDGAMGSKSNLGVQIAPSNQHVVFITEAGRVRFRCICACRYSNDLRLGFDLRKTSRGFIARNWPNVIGQREVSLPYFDRPRHWIAHSSLWHQTLRLRVRWNLFSGFASIWIVTPSPSTHHDGKPQFTHVSISPPKSGARRLYGESREGDERRRPSTS
jgi:hypothetical protein